MKIFGVVARLKAPKGCIGVWVNMYKHGKIFQSGGVYETRKHADVIAKKHRYDCIYVHVRIENGHRN